MISSDWCCRSIAPNPDKPETHLTRTPKYFIESILNRGIEPKWDKVPDEMHFSLFQILYKYMTSFSFQS
jgi:hypothetical protein